MQSYDKPAASRNVNTSATLPTKVNVPLPGTNTNQTPYSGGMSKTPAGFGGGLINGKV